MREITLGLGVVQLTNNSRSGKTRYPLYLLDISFDSNVEVWSLHCRSEVRVGRAPSHSIPDIALHIAKS